MANKVEVTVLMENTVFEMGLKAEHGLSMLIRTGDRSMLFDTGSSSAFAENARKLEVDLGSIDFLVLSHNHYDHTGGVEHLLGLRPGLSIYGHQGVFRAVWRVSIVYWGGSQAEARPDQRRRPGLPTGLRHPGSI